jgi:16S rRNA (cytidine1402-2'-O)-methyltransferase
MYRLPKVQEDGNAEAAARRLSDGIARNAFAEGQGMDQTPGVRGFLVAGARRPVAAPAPGLYIVSTPIGNLGDMTLRGLEILAGVDRILAEDTRLSRRLLDHYGIETPMSPYHEHNADTARPQALARLEAGEALALISDAGTPLISDPGYKLGLEAAARGVRVFPVPGASAMLAALVASGLPTDRFFFEGFLPVKTEARRARLNAMAAIDATLVFYEAPQRLAASLADLAAELGPRPARVARELTKLHETVHAGTLAGLAAEFAAAETVKGEIVIVVAPPAPQAEVDDATITRELVALLDDHTTKDAAAILAARYALPRRDLYARALELSRGRGR